MDFSLSSSMLEIAAFEDDFDYFYRFANPSVIPKASTNWLAKLVRSSSLSRPERLNLVILVQGEDEIWMLRELVGSIHSILGKHPMSSPPLINIIGGWNISKSDGATIKLWEHVDYYNLSELLFGFTTPNNLDGDNDLLRMVILDIFIKKFGAAVWIDPRVFFAESDGRGLEQIRVDLATKGMVTFYEDLVPILEGYDAETFTTVHAVAFDDCVKKLNCSQYIKKLRDHQPITVVGGEKYQLQSLLPKPADPAKRGQMYCHLALRQEIMYNPQLFTSGRDFISQWAHPGDEAIHRSGSGKKRIAFLIPSKNDSEEMGLAKVHLLQTFLKSMLDSVMTDEWNQFQYVIYVGYDQDDPILDERRPQVIDEIDRMLGSHQRDVLFKFHRLPTAKCITLLWNLLFLDAIADGNDYFYQVNDDVSILNAGWSSKFVTKLQENDDFGVVGPNDQLWQCQFLTQSFVSRRHWEIFGWYFPTIIKDWFSDNWISDVYGAKHTHCIREAGIKNGAAKTRYSVCDKPKWREAVKEGKSMIENWQRNRTRIH